MNAESSLREKQVIRERILKLRAAADPGELARHGAEIAGRVKLLPQWRAAGFVCSYVASKLGEVATLPLIESALAERKRVCVPVIDRRDRGLYLVEVTSLEGFVPGPFGILEPAAGRRLPPAELPWDLALVPGLAFDRLGRRIGFGKGYYDRLLSERAAPRIGLAFSFQLIQRVPTLPHDVPVDLVVTESETITARRESD